MVDSKQIHKTSMSLSSQQQLAFDKIFSWLNETKSIDPLDYGDKWMFCLSGYAGTGKTYLLGKLIPELGCDYHCAAPTGKAASVLMSKLNDIDVSTIHSLLYVPVTEDVEKIRNLIAKCALHPEDEELKKELSDEVEKVNKKGPGFASRENSSIKPGDLVIVDEASMVDERVRDDLRRTGCRALFVGDSGQLPPVGSSGWFIKIKPDVALDEIQRQALDNPIIRLSMDVRDGVAKPRDWRKKQGCGIWLSSEVDPAVWMSSDQVITGSNASRRKINRFFRKQLGFSKNSSLPVKGEKLICLKNDNKRIPQFINGTQFTSLDDAEELETKNGISIGMMSINYEGVDLNHLHFYSYHALSNYVSDLSEVPREMRRHLMELDYAYAITCHKSQGSEWNKVIIADDEMMKSDPVFRRRWLYTAITRAKKELLIIQTDKSK